MITESQQKAMDSFKKEFKEITGIDGRWVETDDEGKELTLYDVSEQQKLEQAEEVKDKKQEYTDEFYDVVRSLQADHKKFVGEMSDNGATYEVGGRVWMFVQLAKLACKIDGIEIKNN